MNEIEKLDSELDIEFAKINFWEFEKYINPEFFKESRPHLKILADILQKLYEGKLLLNGNVCKKLIINLPRRHGKSYTLILFSQWILGKNNDNKIITISYNDTLSGRFSKAVRDGIEATKIEEDKHIFSDIFTAKIKQGDASAYLWSLQGKHFNYLGGSIGGTITGMGCNVGIIDDPIKNREDAYNDRILQSHYDFYRDTFIGCLEEDSIEIINHTRWNKNDLAGRLLDTKNWYVLKMEVYNETTNKMLCSELLSYEKYLLKQKIMSRDIFMANYHQLCIDVEGALYKQLKTYTNVPKDDNGNILFEKICNYTDTADEGSDYLCSICYGIYNKEAYVIDIIYTKSGMEITEHQTAKMLYDNNVNIAIIESNNGGRGFARAVERILKEEFNSNKTIIKWFHQSKPKKSRINTNSSWVQEHIYFPVNWNDKWINFYNDVIGFQKEGKNKNDDAPDCLTGIAESDNYKITPARFTI